MPSLPHVDPAGRPGFPRRFGRYVLLRELGAGGMGQVFMAVTGQAGLERVCALKIIKDITKDRDSEDLGQRFLDEAKVVTKLSHENLVYVFDFGLVRRQGYLAMEYLQGKTLTEVWNRCAQKGVGFPVGVSLFMVSELCAGLGYAHGVAGLGLVHRDVSPSNVMLSYTGGVKLIDFGLAKWKSKVAQTATGINWGKMSYMSPEQYLGKALDHRSDLFSAGVILWELLTGRQLFPSTGSRSQRPEIVPPSRLNGHITAELDAVVLKALALDPEERFQTGEEMCAALSAHLPREAGKLEIAEFLRRLFQIDRERERDEQARLVAGAAALAEAGAVPSPAAGLDDSLSDPHRDGDPLVGATLGDRYFVRRLIGEGAMGRVYEGHHTGVGKRVAIKVPRRAERRRTELLQRFKLEANAASQIGHPNIADVTDCGSTPDGNFFFVMEFIDGIDLDRLVRREGALPLERALVIALQIARALEAAHKAGIIHRDLKPSNVMLVRGREEPDFAKVLDFGVAKFLRADGSAGGPDAPAGITLSDAAVGTPRYMAPEQIEAGREIDFRADIYALGGILYYMLSGGEAPHDGETVENVWRKKMFEDPAPLGRWRSDLPAAAEALVMRCLARDAGRRPASMDELRRELVQLLEGAKATGASLVAMRVPSSTALVGTSRRTGRRTGLAVAAAASVAVAGALLFEALRERDGTSAPVPRPPTQVAAEQPVDPAVETAPGTTGPAAPAQPLPDDVPAAAAKAAKQPSAPPAPGPSVKPTSAPPAPAPLAKAVAPASPPGAKPQAAAAGLPAKGPAPMPPGNAASLPTPRHPAEEAADPAAAGTAPPPLSEAEALIERGETLFQEASFDAALASANEARRKVGSAREPRVRVLRLLGKIHASRGDYDKAIDAYDGALAIDPTDRIARIGREQAEAARGGAAAPADAP